MTESTFKLCVKIPRRVRVEEETCSREVFSQWLWDRFQADGLVGVHEGTLLTSEASEQGLETESWTVDAGEAPRERDWIGGQAELSSELYFSGRAEAERAAAELRTLTDIEVTGIEEQKAQDWDAQWKASFLGAKDGVFVPPSWRILPPWVEQSSESRARHERPLKINPGAGFGTGTHETTQLCLQGLVETGAVSPGCRVLDFGSGSGILAIGAALLGGQVDAVEIDPLAIDNALENARLNQVQDRIHYSRALATLDSPPYDCVIANILKPVLLEFAERLVERLKPGGPLILSGLIESDVAAVEERYSMLLGGRKPRVEALAEWRAVIWEARRE